MTATVTLDKTGRFVIPKAMRGQLHLRAGAKLRLNVIGDRIELSEDVPEVKIVRKKDGLRVVVGWEGFDAAQAVREMREEQVARLEAPFPQEMSTLCRLMQTSQISTSASSSTILCHMAKRGTPA